MGFVQRDVLLRQIELLAHGLAKAVAGDHRDDDPLDDATVVQAAGLGLDIAESMPPDAVASLVGNDPDRLIVLGLALGRRAWRDDDRPIAWTALRLIDRAAELRPLSPAVLEARAALLTLV